MGKIKKGFTVVEVVIALSMLGVVLISLFGFVSFYRDKTRSEDRGKWCDSSYGQRN